MWRFALCLLVAISLIIASAPVRADDTDSRLDHLENEVQTLSRAVFKGDVPPSADATEAIPGGAAAAASAGTQARLAAMDQSIQQLTGKVEEQGHTIEQLQQQLDQMKTAQAAPPAPAAATKPPLPDTDNLPDSASGTDATPPAAGKGASAGTDTSSDPPKQLGTLNRTPSGAIKASGSDPANQYEDAFAALRNKHYDDAKTGFKAFLAKYPNSSLAPNAQYWLGESYYATNDFPSAARAFAAAYQKYPHGAKAPDALLKLALSLAGMNKNDDACLSLTQLKKQYATGAAAVLARADQERQTLGCK